MIRDICLLSGQVPIPVRYPRHMGQSRIKPRQSSGKNWLASSKTTNAAAIAALGVSIIALVLSAPVYPHIEALFAASPEADFVYPNPSTTTAPAGFSVSISSNNVPVSSDLWFIVRAGTQHEWYPFDLINPNGTWSIADICPATGKQILQIWLVPDSQESTLLTYLDSKHGSYTQGLTSLGSRSATELAARTMYVRKKCAG